MNHYLSIEFFCKNLIVAQRLPVANVDVQLKLTRLTTMECQVLYIENFAQTDLAIRSRFGRFGTTRATVCG